MDLMFTLVRSDTLSISEECQEKNSQLKQGALRLAAAWGVRHGPAVWTGAGGFEGLCSTRAQRSCQWPVAVSPFLEGVQQTPWKAEPWTTFCSCKLEPAR